MALYMDVGLNDILRIGDTDVTIERKSGTRARLRITGKSPVELVRNGKSLAEAQAETKKPGEEE